MPTVNSVLGPLDTDDLGFTLTHEHLFTASAGIQQTYPELFGDFQKLTEQTILTLNEAREGGVKTIVDLSTLDLGRNVRFLAEMSTRGSTPRNRGHAAAFRGGRFGGRPRRFGGTQRGNGIWNRSNSPMVQG